MLGMLTSEFMENIETCLLPDRLGFRVILVFIFYFTMARALNIFVSA